MRHLPSLSRIATDAIIAQLAYCSNGEATKYADVDGVEREFTVHYMAEWDGRDVDCEITGAWVSDPDTGDASWAGNKAELEALIGDRQVRAWQDDISESVYEKGRW